MEKYLMRGRLRALVLTLACALCVLGTCALPSLARADDDVDATWSADEEPTVSSPAAFLIDRDTGTVLLSKNADETHYPASTTKVMTALLVLENASLDDTLTMEQADFDELTSDSSTAGLKVGETLTVRDLLACLLLPSGNEAAYALARHVSGDWQTFVDLMNARAAELGCTGTHFANPCGLHDDDHYTTAHDLALIFEAALTHDAFVEIAGSGTWDLPATNENSARTLETTDLLADPSSPVYMGGLVVAAKTGYTLEAGKCLVASAQSDEMRLVGVVMDASSVADASGVTQNFYDMRTMFEWGFGAWTTGNVVSGGDALTSADVRLSRDGDAVDAVSTGSVLATVPKGTTLADLTVQPSWDEPLRAPVEAGQELGEATVLLGDRVLGTTGASAAYDMRLSVVDFVIDWLSDPIHLVLAVFVFVTVMLAIGIASSRIRRHRSPYQIAVGERRSVAPGVGGQRLRPPTSSERRGGRHAGKHSRR
ncbi:D-alanyl-D-alanine carboxypeptidase family protein [Thermophilibacter immobilis]|uniref:serine-type D-Ala-D-Ala carboxypeptidase n=1 Tax=Thermophilibacter immobilis TaxID=2779519 RepID=A0A7S7M8B9_9ACTN|nr:D-alanyl-D-alanine carboxypeptidase family protein [Thermophilibacter immobilis]QOY60307.1 D-alanyl-D-alanine carboxypeptidase [Thermophilibacter immobilis]